MSRNKNSNKFRLCRCGRVAMHSSRARLPSVSVAQMEAVLTRKWENGSATGARIGRLAEWLLSPRSLSHSANYPRGPTDLHFRRVTLLQLVSSGPFQLAYCFFRLFCFQFPVFTSPRRRNSCDRQKSRNDLTTDDLKTHSTRNCAQFFPQKIA